ncbi:MAG: biopolymer transporter ExbD [Halioglobus sp.]
MSSSLRARRLSRNIRKMKQQPKLNLVALMDIFTILVLFLMVNNGDVEVLQADDKVTLPESVSEQRPELALTVKVGASDIFVQGKRIQSIASALAEDEQVLVYLKSELLARAERASEDSQLQAEKALAVIIMGDREMPYSLLKRIMATCADVGYRDIALAVDSRPEFDGGGPLSTGVEEGA